MVKLKQKVVLFDIDDPGRYPTLASIVNKPGELLEIDDTNVLHEGDIFTAKAPSNGKYQRLYRFEGGQMRKTKYVVLRAPETRESRAQDYVLIEKASTQRKTTSK